MSVPSLAVADPQPGNMELVSKVSARQLFATSKQKWYEKVRHAAASGMAKPLWQAGSRSVGMSVPAPHGTVSTVLRYDIRDARPSAVLFAFAYASSPARTFTDSSVDEIIALVKRQMAPEFHVVGHTDRLRDGVGVFFFITQSKAEPPRGHARRTLRPH